MLYFRDFYWPTEEGLKISLLHGRSKNGMLYCSESAQHCSQRFIIRSFQRSLIQNGKMKSAPTDPFNFHMILAFQPQFLHQWFIIYSQFLKVFASLPYYFYKNAYFKKFRKVKIKLIKSSFSSQTRDNHYQDFVNLFIFCLN